AHQPERMDPTRLRLPGEPNRRSPQHVLAGTDTALGHPRMLRCTPPRWPCDKPLLPGQVGQQQGSDRPPYEPLDLLAWPPPLALLQTHGHLHAATSLCDLWASSRGPVPPRPWRCGPTPTLPTPRAATVTSAPRPRPRYCQIVRPVATSVLGRP